MTAIQYDVNTWLDNNKHFFVPPVCNKLMYKDGQLKVFFVGGPNQRKDFHMEEGEEFFYMLKGDMTLVVYERGRFRDITIREGEVFMLPARIPHSPQRYADTIGLVIERERKSNELDLLRYYVDGSDEILYEKWFYCRNLEELPPLIKEFFESKQFETGKPIPGTILEDKPIKQDYDRKLQDPFSLKTFLHSNHDALEKEGKVKLFNGDYVSRIHVLGKGPHSPDPDLPETFLWQIEGASTVTLNSKDYVLRSGETLLLPAGEEYVIQTESRNRILSVVMNPLSE